ncbi:hypothetical protein AAG906_023821 [Vitis piasezkii]
MDCVSPILDVASHLWDCTAKRAAYLTDLQETLESLRNAIEELKNEDREMRRTHEVDGWLHRVQVLENEVREILQKGDQEIQQKCLGTCCPKNCRSSYKIGKIASKKLGAVTELRSKGCFSDVADRLPRAAVDERPIEKTVGLDRMYAEVCRCIQDEQLGIIGLYGMGGAGKTTLMTKVNNEFFKTGNDFEVAIWVVVSRPASVGKIPDDIWRNRSEDEKAVEIFNVLKAKRFVMLLDDVWERLDLHKVGVPSPDSQNKSKVILTTRSLDVCRDIEAQKSIKVECLTQDEAINLFKKKVGETTLNSHPDIPQLAEIAAEECKGLPLALVTIGRAMAGKNTPQEWERAIQMLKTYPSMFSGMGDHVFPILKFSYDNLQNDTIKACFLYLAIFPEDYAIGDKILILLWMAEGFLDGFAGIDEAFNQGHHIIEHLKTACLFESDEYDQVKMHDVIRDMALWLASKYSGNKNGILVEEVDTVEAHQVSKWKGAQRMFLSTSSLKELTAPPSFPNLSTLIFRNQVLETLPSGLFHFMPVIRVLDLSRTKIIELPVGIGRLVTLQYLNLSGTKLRELSTELKTLKRIRYLVLANMPYLKMISKEVISNLSMMRYFSIRPNNLMDNKAYYSPKEEEDNCSQEDRKTIYLWEDSKALLEELEGLKHINWVSLPISGAMCGPHFSRRPHSIGETRFYLHKSRFENERGQQGFVADYIPNSNFYSLRSVRVHQLPKVLDLTWLIYIPSLEDLEAGECDSMKEVIGDTSVVSENFGIFSRLKILSLSNLPNLESISGRALTFPSLTNLWVKKCPNLRKLPFDSNSARSSLKTIRGESEWWEGLQWDDETTKHTFNPYLEETIIVDEMDQVKWFLFTALLMLSVT